jgi:hypothetical protein
MRLLVSRVLLLCVAGVVSLGVGTAGAAAQTPGESKPIPVLAYYYIWFNPTSWNRAKTDYPLLGRYSSNEQRAMRKHIEWAKEAGIDGFIVSWKSTQELNPRLEKLIDIARTERFKLVIIYQGLDFERQPQPVERVASDFDYFADRYAGDEVFNIFDKPAIIWSGTWEFSRGEIADVTRTRRDRLRILASEKHPDDYRRVQDLVDGDAYYWSSVNPDTYPRYAEKLHEMASVVHAKGGLWIAPAAPGFDARLVGGTSVVPRKDGATLREEINAAFSSSPDALGLISWNEFSENSHVEPSEKHGDRYLRVLADVNGTTFGADIDLDSSTPGGGVPYGLPLVAGVVLLVLVGGLYMRRGRSEPDGEPAGAGDRPVEPPPGEAMAAPRDRAAEPVEQTGEAVAARPSPFEPPEGGGEIRVVPRESAVQAPAQVGEIPGAPRESAVEPPLAETKVASGAGGTAVVPSRREARTAVASTNDGVISNEELATPIGSSPGSPGLTNGNEAAERSNGEPGEEQSPRDSGPPADDLGAPAHVDPAASRELVELGSSRAVGVPPRRLPLIAGAAAVLLAGRVVIRRRRRRR